MVEMNNHYNYINKVIRSCDKQKQIPACRKMIENFMNRFTRNVLEAIHSKIKANELVSRIIIQQELIESLSLTTN